MKVELNHTIVWCRDKRRSAAFLTQMLGLPEAVPFGPVLVVKLTNGASLDFYEQESGIASQHYAFLLDDGGFDAALARVRARALPYWADPGKQRANEVYTHNGGRGTYFDDPDGHLLEIMTRPYGGDS